ncbi:Guanylyl cyclase 1 like protein [Argiope bruennichi]|uniref:Guanylyl cyclase 1 like protein n=1 Tax=Argiope bruennichi TaxID=94029 RepID=A0A8T0G0H6_ARGBR|nr:Guanylyl cyclase 1 like protein [Argiope bruennichi]
MGGGAREVDSIEIPLVHVKQHLSWDCGISAVMMVLSTWTIDLAYLLQKFGVSHLYLTITLGVNPGYSEEDFYQRVLKKDAQRINDRFSAAHLNNVKVEKRPPSVYSSVDHHQKSVSYRRHGGGAIMWPTQDYPLVVLREKSQLAMGCSCSLMALSRGFYVVMASIFVFGVVSSGLIAVFPMVIFEFFEKGMHTMGQASRYCFFGLFSCLNGPMIGYFRDTVGSYSWLYHTIAVVSVICGALSALIPVLARIRDGKREKKRTS